MKNRRHSQTDDPGQDSFLDIVANLVGILIILIMLVGIRTKDALIKASLPQETAEEAIDVESPKSMAGNIENDIHELGYQLKTQQIAVEMRNIERSEALRVVSLLEQEVNKKRSLLDKDRRIKFDLQRQLEESQKLHADLKRSQFVVSNTAAQPTVLQHVPTPLAQTVFGKEVHFRLKGGRLAIVPFDELVRQLKAAAPQKVWKLKNSPRITETLGPIGGFWMKYTLARGKFVKRTSTGPVFLSGYQLEEFVLLQTDNDLGESLEMAFRKGSQMNLLLSGLPPEQTTVTVWVYPDSYEQFRDLKDNLLRRGYLTAGRPMPAGRPIGGSPGGSRSVAQ